MFFSRPSVALYSAGAEDRDQKVPQNLIICADNSNKKIDTLPVVTLTNSLSKIRFIYSYLTKKKTELDNKSFSNECVAAQSDKRTFSLGQKKSLTRFDDPDVNI